MLSDAVADDFARIGETRAARIAAMFPFAPLLTLRPKASTMRIIAQTETARGGFTRGASA